MALHAAITSFLEQRRVPFTTFSHRAAFTAQGQAAASHVPGWHWAKSVVCVADGQPVFAVLPAPCVIDLERLKALTGVKELRLADEDEMSRLFPDCEVGATPPFGVLYGYRVFVDRALVGDPEMVFDGGNHGCAIRMHYGDFVEVAQPIVGSFGRVPTSKQAPSRAA
jgi:Ala-tRNA(Pro) deacylase